MLSFGHDHLPGPPGTLYYHILLQLDGKLMMVLNGTPQRGFTLQTFASLQQAIYTFNPITSLLKNKPPNDLQAGEAKMYLLRIWPLIIAFPKGSGNLAGYVEDPHVMGSPLLQTAEPVGLVRMRPSVRRFVVHDLVKSAMPGIEEIGRSDGSIHYRWAQIHFHGPKGN